MSQARMDLENSMADTLELGAKLAAPSAADSDAIDIRTSFDISGRDMGSSTADRSITPLLLMQFFYMLAIGISVPVYPDVMTGTTVAQGDKVKGGTWMQISMFVNAGLEFVSASFLGELSDRFGRRPFLILASLGQCLDFTIAGFAATDSETYHVSFKHGAQAVVVARAIAGLCGNLNIFTRASVGDLSRPADSAKNFAKLGASIGIAMILGPGIGGIYYKIRKRLRSPMMVAVAVNALNIIIAWRMEEPLLQENRSKTITWKNASPIGSIKFLFSQKFLVFFGSMCLFDSFALQLLISTIVPYTQEIYGWGVAEAAMLMVIFGICLVLTIIFLLPLILKQSSTLFAVQLGYAITSSGYFLFALAYYFDKSGMSLYVLIAYYSIGSISNPTQLSLASLCVDASDQGKLQGANGSLDTIGKILGPLIAASVFSPSVKAGMPNLLWWIASIFMLPGLVLSCMIVKFLPDGVNLREFV